MSFNLKNFLSKKASQNLDVTTEGQLDNRQSNPNSLQESQLDNVRHDSPISLAEKQLDAVRSGKAQKELTEAQFLSGRKIADGITEKQLSKSQYGGSLDSVEKRLDNVRTAQAENEEPPQEYVSGHEGRCPRCGALMTCTDKDCHESSGHEAICPDCLSEERQSSFNLKDFFKKSAKKSDAEKTTEGQFGKRNDSDPSVLTEKQLDNSSAAKQSTTESLLEKARTGEADRLVEARLDDNNSKLMAHRNPDASKGNIHKLEEQRIKAGTLSEQEKYDAASKTDKALMLPEVKGKDGLRTAAKVPGPEEFGYGLNAEAMKLLKQYDIGPSDLFRYMGPNTPFADIYAGIQAAQKGDNATLQKALEQRFGKNNLMQRRLSSPVQGQISREASRKTKLAQFDEPFNIGYMERETPGWDEGDTFERITANPDRLTEKTRSDRRLRRQELEDLALIDELTKDIDVPSDDDLQQIDENDDELDQNLSSDEVLPEEEEGGSLNLPEAFVEDTIKDFEVGATTMRQIILSFDPEEFDDKTQVIGSATGYMFSKHPALFGAKIEISKSMSVSMDNGKVTITLPVSAFAKKERRKPQRKLVPNAPTDVGMT